MGLLRLFTFLDLFGQPISLRVKDQQYAKTPMGGIFTIILIVMAFLLAFYQFQTMVSRSKPTIDTEIIILNESPSLTLDRFTIPISLQ